jgi:acetyl-CoA carboxylase biotin carboxyl carrier protein
LDNSLDLKEIRQIVELMKRHDLSLFHLERDGMKIKLKKGVDFDTLVNAVSRGTSMPAAGSYPMPTGAGMRLDPMLPAVGGAEETAAPAPAALASSAGPAGPALRSPMVGTFYRSPAPGEPAYVKEGDTVSEGQVICIIEAMKVMNDVKAERSGTISRVLVDDGAPVAYDQPLFELKPA